MIPTLLSALEHHGQLKLGKADRDRVLAISAATIDRLLGDVNVVASGGKRRRAGFYSAIRREVLIRTFNDWNGPPPAFCEVDMVAHGGTSVAGTFIQTVDNGRCRHALDRVPTVGDAQWPAFRGDQPRTKFVPWLLRDPPTAPPVERVWNAARLNRSVYVGLSAPAVQSGNIRG
jgi:hypothetical protein